MNVTLKLSEEKASAFQTQATAAGLTLEEWLEQLGEDQLRSPSIAHLQKTNPKEWAQQFDVWLDSRDPNTPVLSDEAMSRESIYPDRV